MNKATPFLMFNDQLEAAIELYTSTFPDSKVTSVARSGENGPITAAELVICGQPFRAYNGGPHFSFSDGFSILVACDDQDEVDEYWARLLDAGAIESRCGWITDAFGLSWQIVPKRFFELTNDPDPQKVRAVMNAMLQMVKLDIAELERAYAEA